MRVLVACKRGNIAERDASGHCRCDDCKAFNAATRRRSAPHKLEYKRAWLKRNPDKARGYTKKWNAANKEKRRAIERSWRDRHPEIVAAMSARAGKKWSANNKGPRNAITRARTAARLHRTPPWADLEQIKSVYIEAARLSAATGVPHEVDHIVPLQGEFVSGLHVEYNLQILPRSINRSKRNKYEVSLSASS